MLSFNPTVPSSVPDASNPLLEEQSDQESLERTAIIALKTLEDYVMLAEEDNLSPSEYIVDLFSVFDYPASHLEELKLPAAHLKALGLTQPDPEFAERTFPMALAILNAIVVAAKEITDDPRQSTRKMYHALLRASRVVKNHPELAEKAFPWACATINAFIAASKQRPPLPRTRNLIKLFGRVSMHPEWTEIASAVLKAAVNSAEEITDPNSRLGELDRLSNGALELMENYPKCTEEFFPMFLMSVNKTSSVIKFPSPAFRGDVNNEYQKISALIRDVLKLVNNPGFVGEPFPIAFAATMMLKEPELSDCFLKITDKATQDDILKGVQKIIQAAQTDNSEHQQSLLDKITRVLRTHFPAYAGVIEEMFENTNGDFEVIDSKIRKYFSASEEERVGYAIGNRNVNPTNGVSHIAAINGRRLEALTAFL